MSPAEQVVEVLAALSLNETLLAELFGVSRPTLYDWLAGKEPNTANAQRLSTLVRLLANAGVTAATPLSARFVREPLNDGEPSSFCSRRARSTKSRPTNSAKRTGASMSLSAERRRIDRRCRRGSMPA